MKNLYSIRYIYKINSSKIVKGNRDIILDYDKALANEEVISLASSNTLRMIDKINGEDFFAKEKEIKNIKKELKMIRKSPKNMENLIKLREKQKELHNKTFMTDYLCVVMDTKKDYDLIGKANKGFKLNGNEYVRLLATPGGVKKSTVIFCSKRIYNALYGNLNAERDMSKLFVVAKLEAYISLACSASVPVSKPNGVLVVHDIETKFNADVIEVNGQAGGRPVVQEIDNYDITLNACDGMGLMLPSLAKRWSEEVEEDYTVAGVCLRHAFTKGMVYTFNFVQFAEEVANTYMIKDVWGHEHDIRNIELVLTTSMLKLWDSYSSVEDWLTKAERNHHTFALTKITPEELDKEQTLNYQFLQSIDMTDEDVEELCKPFIESVEGIMNKDYTQALLYLRGVDLKDKTVLQPPFDYTTAMMLDETMLNDPYVYSKIKHNIRNRIDRAKMGVIPVRGNFSLISGDPYILCESMFGMQPKGLLKAGEFYSKFWNDRNVEQVMCCRAPQTNENNTLIRKIANNEQTNKWYQYMDTVTIFNAWDTSCHALNGADFDKPVTLSK